jgi:hypothetical protein
MNTRQKLEWISALKNYEGEWCTGQVQFEDRVDCVGALARFKEMPLTNNTRLMMLRMGFNEQDKDSWRVIAAFDNQRGAEETRRLAHYGREEWAELEPCERALAALDTLKTFK